MLILMYMSVSIVMSFAFSRWADKYLPNPILLRCSSCGSKLHMRLHGKWGVLERSVYAFALWFLILRLRLPFGVSLALAVVFVFAWGTAVDRLVHSYWTWRHPLRCDGGGHTKPKLSPQGA